MELGTGLRQGANFTCEPALRSWVAELAVDERAVERPTSTPPTGETCIICWSGETDGYGRAGRLAPHVPLFPTDRPTNRPTDRPTDHRSCGYIRRIFLLTPLGRFVAFARLFVPSVSYWLPSGPARAPLSLFLDEFWTRLWSSDKNLASRNCNEAIQTHDARLGGTSQLASHHGGRL